jgi:hypothetical protein
VFDLFLCIQIINKGLTYSRAEYWSNGPTTSYLSGERILPSCVTKQTAGLRCSVNQKPLSVIPRNRALW